MNANRTLRLRKEVLTQLTDDELRSIDGAADEGTSTIIILTIFVTATIDTVLPTSPCEVTGGTAK